jgi:hypothetical protein
MITRRRKRQVGRGQKNKKKKETSRKKCKRGERENT